MPEAVLTVGDPVAMRALAQQLMARAELIDGTAGGATSPLDQAIFEGSAADRLRGSASDARRQVFDAASRLREVAGDLLVDAAEVERQNRELQAEAQAREDEAARAAADRSPGAPGGATPTPAPAPTPAVPPIDAGYGTRPGEEDLTG